MKWLAPEVIEQMTSWLDDVDTVVLTGSKTIAYDTTWELAVAKSAFDATYMSNRWVGVFPDQVLHVVLHFSLLN